MSAQRNIEATDAHRQARSDPSSTMEGAHPSTARSAAQRPVVGMRSCRGRGAAAGIACLPSHRPQMGGWSVGRQTLVLALGRPPVQQLVGAASAAGGGCRGAAAIAPQDARMLGAFGSRDR